MRHLDPPVREAASFLTDVLRDLGLLYFVLGLFGVIAWRCL